MISILIPTCNRNGLLRFGLGSIQRFGIESEYEIILLDENHKPDSETKRLIGDFGLNIKYVHSGNTKNNNTWRCPSYPLNIGIKQSIGDIVILTCPEIYHVTSCVNEIAHVARSDKQIAITSGIDDKNRKILSALESGASVDYVGQKLNTKLPFLMAVQKKELIDIGGYDEDFVGCCYDDVDLTHRLILNGCHYQEVSEAKIIHLYHKRGSSKGKGYRGRININKSLYLNRKNQIKRNENIEWGRWN